MKNSTTWAGWVKAFSSSLPLDVPCGSRNNSTHNVVNYDPTSASWSNLRAYDFLYDFIFFIDLLFTTVGYALCFRPIDTHLRSAEPTFLGWGVALFCYEPFFGMLFERQYVHYQGLGFGNWLATMPGLRWAWGITILLLITVYVLATVAFGVRFSNLTHRGILTNGPYRFTKHPAYVAKNLSWWLLSIPFIPNESLATSIKHCVGLLLVNFIYYMRAKTEERHLSLDPTYVRVLPPGWTSTGGSAGRSAVPLAEVARSTGRWRWKASVPPTSNSAVSSAGEAPLWSCIVSPAVSFVSTGDTVTIPHPIDRRSSPDRSSLRLCHSRRRPTRPSFQSVQR